MKNRKLLNRRDKTRKADESKIWLEIRKLRLEYVLICLGIIGAVGGGAVAVFQKFFPSSPTEEANLEIVNFQIDNNESYPKIAVKLRNTGGKVAYLKEARLILKEPQITEKQGHAASEVHPVRYNWLITLKDIEKRRGEYSLSRKIDSNDTDNLEFVVGFEKLKATLNSEFQLELLYNNNQSVVLPLSKISITNSYGDYPVFITSDSDEELLEQLKEIKTAYTAGQILTELTERKVEKAAYLVNDHLRHDDPNVRTSAAKYFTVVKYTPAVSNLTVAIRDNSPDVRNFAAKALENQGEEALAEVGRLAKDDDPAIRELAADLIKRIRKKAR